MTNSKQSTDSDFNWNLFNICLGLMVTFTVTLVLIGTSPAFLGEGDPNCNKIDGHVPNGDSFGWAQVCENFDRVIQSPSSIAMIIIVMAAGPAAMLIIRYC